MPAPAFSIMRARRSGRMRVFVSSKGMNLDLDVITEDVPLRAIASQAENRRQ